MTKTVVITGASSGIGLAIAQRFDTAGYRVCNLDLHAGAVGEFYECDVTDHGLVQSHIQHIAADAPIDVLVANAGIHFSATIVDTSPADLQRVFDINVKGAFAAIQAVIPSMQAQQNGAIILVGSDQSVIAKPHSFAYNLSKHALASMAKTTALDYAADNIRCNILCPGTTDTALYQNAIKAYCDKHQLEPASVHAEEAALQPLNRIATPAEIASMAFYLASDEASFITGAMQVMDGGYSIR